MVAKSKSKLTPQEREILTEPSEVVRLSHPSETLPLMTPDDFTGIARTVVCYNTNGMYRNFKIATLHIKKGKIEKIDYSDPYAVWEAAQWLDYVNDISMLSLNNRWKDQKALDVVKDQRIYWENRENK